MITALVIYAALTIGACLGFFLAPVLRAGASPAPTRPEALAAEPREIVAVYEAKLEMEKRNTPGPVETPRRGVSTMSGGDDEKVMVDYFPMSRDALAGRLYKKWEKEQNKREKRRVR